MLLMLLLVEEWQEECGVGRVVLLLVFWVAPQVKADQKLRISM